MSVISKFSLASVLVCLLTTASGYTADSSGVTLSPQTPIHMSGDSRVHKTALRELAIALGDAVPDSLRVVADDSPEPGSMFVGLLNESKTAQGLALQDKINLHNVAPDMDAYEILVHDGALFLLGNTPRGMLHAVYKLQETAREERVIDVATHLNGTFQIPKRFFHQRFSGWPGETADIRYISHLGASHCLMTHDWQGDLRHLQAYVTSDIFPAAMNPESVEGYRRDLRRVIDDCLDYGLEPALWITELPCQGGPWVPEATRQEFLTRFPGDVLSDSGTYQGKVLCFAHPKVQDFYRDLVTRFFREFPEVSTLFVFGMDSGGEFCDPEKCSRCKGITKFEQRDRLIRFLLEEGQKVRPGLRVLTTGWGWAGDTEQFLARQKALPAGSGLYLAAETDGWQPERQCHDLLRNARAICGQQGQLFIGYDDFHWGDDTVHDLNDIQDYPLGIGAKIRRWHSLNVDGVFDHWGGFNQDISCNSIACRDFFLNPLADPEAVCKGIAVRQFGEEAGPLAFQAWQSLEKAHGILSNACTWPPGQWPGWYSGREHAPVPEELAEFGVKGGEPPRQAESIQYNPPDLAERLQRVGDAWRTAFPHYEEAVRRMNEAVAKADERPLFHAFWWNGESKSPTRREHLRRQGIYIESMARVGREIGLHFSLNALFEGVKGDAAAYRQQAEQLLKEDVLACREAADYLDKLKAQGDDRRSDRDWAHLYRAKADRIEVYLK